MDDVPPGPTGSEPRRPALAVVIPVHNGGDDFGRCLRGLRESRGARFSLTVVDDHSTDGSAAVAAGFGATVLSTGPARGPAAARNAGARASTADVLFFLDADVVPHHDALARALDRFAADPDLDALFGSYDDQPAAPGLVSRFRNLLHHFVHQQGPFRDGVRPARTFWTGCGAIRREVFLGVGGFDPRLYTRPAIEDIEFGYRLTAAGHKIVLARDVLGTHLKRWTLRSMVKTDILQRGVPWLILMKRQKVTETDLNVRPEQKLCVAATGLAGLAALGAVAQPALLALTAACVVLVVALNREFYAFLARGRGLAFAAGAVPLHLVYYGCCGLSVILAEALWRLGLADAAATAPGTPGGPHAAHAHAHEPRKTSRGPRRRRPTRWTGR